MPILRECRRHGLTAHQIYGKASPRVKCKKCASDQVTRRQQQLKRILVAEAGGGCCVCGYDKTVFNLHFHHVDPSTKSFALASSTGRGLAARRAEAKKCVLVCANCHGEIEAGLIPSPPAGTTWTGAPPAS
jgi:hypothetical protein